MRCLLMFAMMSLPFITNAQQNGFPFGKVTYKELELKNYDRDTSAVALVLEEFGEAYVDNNNDNNIIFEYHAKIKILKQAGVSWGDFELAMRKNERAAEKVVYVQASSFNVKNGSMHESKFDPRNIFTQDLHKYLNVTKFAVPNVQIGSVIDVFYKVESPFFLNFHPWQFQSSIPKIKSEFWALIPANYNYTISLKGSFPLTKDESKVIKDCFTPGGVVADCSQYRFAMDNIPAFIEEDYMTASSNFIAAINFELMQIRRFDGRTDRISKEWKDVDEELRESSRFGTQIKRGKDILDSQIEQMLVGEVDPLAKAQKIYDFIQSWYTWNEVYGIFSELGIKKAFDAKTGNVSDINLSLIAALKYAGLNVEPLILSTRSHGLVTELFPVLSDFNYVVAKLIINEKIWFLDATDKHYPFGLLPERCLNGKGRAIGAKGSYWQPINAPQKQRTVTTYSLNMNDAGLISGSVQFMFSGYDAVRQRQQLQKKGEQKYVNDLIQQFPGLAVVKHTLENQDDLKKAVVLKMDVEFHPTNQLSERAFLFPPVMKVSWASNPFKSSQRLYPVDFCVPIEQVTILNLQYPSGYEVEEIPSKLSVNLPQGGAQFLFEVRTDQNKLSVNNSLLISRPVYNANEYAHLKELFNQVIASQQAAVVFKKR